MGMDLQIDDLNLVNFRIKTVKQSFHRQINIFSDIEVLILLSVSYKVRDIVYGDRS